ncbi:MAG TPA: hypothetical protein VF235_03850 [Actinomycetota bacterium]
MRTPIPDRPDEAPSQRRRERKWLPVLAVLATIAFVTGGAASVGDAVSRPVRLAETVRFDPAPGWIEVGRRVEEGLHELLLQRGSAGLYVVVLPEEGGTAVELAESYASFGLRRQYARVTIGDAEAATLGDGVPAVRYGYVGVSTDGVATEGVVVTAVTPDGTGVVFDGFAPQGELAAAIDDLGAMLEGVDLT